MTSSKRRAATLTIALGNSSLIDGNSVKRSLLRAV